MKLLLIAVVTLSLNAAFESGPGDPELLFPYIRAVQDTGSPVCVINAAMLPYCEGLTATASGAKPFYGYGLDSAYAAAQYGGSIFGLTGRWSSFGDSVYRENCAGAGAGLRPFRWLGAGVTADFYMLSIQSGNVSYGRTMYDFGGGFILSPAEWLQSGLMLRNIRSLMDENDLIYGEWSCGLLTRPCMGLSFSWNITDNPAGLINTFTVNVNLLKNISSGFGYSVETSSFALNAGLLWHHIEVNYGLRFHPYLGYSHAVSITYSGRAVTESLSYGKINRLPESRVDIRTVTFEQLYALGILSETSARRVILYREKIGPVTRDALARAGLSPSEIKMLTAHAFGFEKNTGNNSRDALKKKAKKRDYVPRKVQVKRRFSEMIEDGVPAHQAALYSDMCISDTDSFRETLAEDASLDEDQKKIIRRICGD